MKAAILGKIGAPLVVEDIEFDCIKHSNGSRDLLLKEGQVFVRVLCTGICGSQLQEIDGIKGDPSHCPHLLGHEGCGIVKGLGHGVTTVKEGDKVVMHWRKGDGLEAQPAVYEYYDDNEYVPIRAGPITTFSEYAIVSENRVTAVPQDTPNDFAALLGCALSTAICVTHHEAKIKPRDKVVVIGCGGLGLAILIAARGLGARVTAIDRIAEKGNLALSLGAEQFMSRIQPPIVSDYIIDTVGAIDHREMDFDSEYISLQEGGTSGGGFDPPRDIPYCLQLMPWLDWAALITHRISLDQINDGIQLMREGKAGRVMIEFP